MSRSSPLPLVRLAATLAVAVAGAVGGCKKKMPPPPAPPPPPPPVTEGLAEPLPGGAADAAIGVDEALRLVAVADDGAWVLACEGTSPVKLRVVVGDGPGLLFDRAVAASDRDLVVVDGDALVHVDAVARTRRRLGPRGPATIDAASRRVVHVDGGKLVVRDPGVAPRTIDTGHEIGAIWSRGKRWLEVAPGTPSRDLREGSCGFVPDPSYYFPVAERTTVDLDPSGLEAADRVGPELGITGGGEVTLDGAVVVGAECVATVIAALAEPPRALVMCADGHNRVVGAGGFQRRVGGRTTTAAVDQSSIAEHLVLGQRLVCVMGACIDLVTGRDFSTYGTDVVWHNQRTLVRKQGGGLLIDDLDQERTRELALPRIAQAITVDTATGRRTAGPAPKPPEYIDGAGPFLLYGRHVIDTDAATLLATLPDDALAIDRAGRVLVAAVLGRGPLRWRRP